MGISISHGVRNTRSATTIANLGTHLAHALGGSEWREISYLFDGRLCAPESIPPHQAGRIAAILHKAANSRAMEPGWGALAAEFANAANSACRAGEHWEWS